MSSILVTTASSSLAVPIGLRSRWLRRLRASPDSLIVNACGLGRDEFAMARPIFDSINPGVIATAIAAVPRHWGGVTDRERYALACYLLSRSETLRLICAILFAGHRCRRSSGFPVGADGTNDRIIDTIGSLETRTVD